MDLTQSTILLTGAAGGIGTCILAALLAEHPTKIYAADLHPDAPSHPGIHLLTLDITDAQSVAQAAAIAADTTILVNCAGVNLRSRFLTSPTLDDAQREMATNYFGTLAMCRAFAPLLAAHPPGTTAIVNMLSVLARVTLPPVGTYCASKAALLSLTEGIRLELRPRGVRVIGIFPWAVATPMSGPFGGEKVTPEAVAASLVTALRTDQEEAFIHPFAPDIDHRLVTDARALQDAIAV